MRGGGVKFEDYELQADLAAVDAPAVGIDLASIMAESDNFDADLSLSSPPPTPSLASIMAEGSDDEYELRQPQQSSVPATAVSGLAVPAAGRTSAVGDASARVRATRGPRPAAGASGDTVLSASQPPSPSRRAAPAVASQPLSGNAASHPGAGAVATAMPRRRAKPGGVSTAAGGTSSSGAAVGDTAGGAASGAAARRDKHGKVLRSLMCSRMSQHMASPATQREAGIPTVICVHGVMMAVGTSRGYVLVYDIRQELRMMLGSAKLGTQCGQVTSIECNSDTTRLLVGHENGQICRWDLGSGKQLNTISNCYEGSAVTGVAFLSDHTGALSNDAQGSVFQHTFKRTLGVRTVDNNCLWPKADGEICLIKVLHYHLFDSANLSPEPPHAIVALGQLSKVTIAYVTPNGLKTALQIPRLEGDGDKIPSLSWNCVPIIYGEERRYVVDPVLAFGWGRTVRFMHVISRKGRPTNFKTLSTYSSPVPVISIRWLSAQVIMSMDADERVHVVDVRAMTLVDIVDLTRVQLVFNDKFSVQQCRAKKRNPRAPSLKSYDQAIQELKGNVYLLGMNSVHLINIMSWSDRLAFLTGQGKFVEALRLAQSFHDDSALAVAGLPRGDPAEQHKLCAQKIFELLQAYADISISNPPRGPEHELLDYFRGVAGLCTEHCLRLHNHGLLFGGLYNTFSNHPVGRRGFLELLPALIKDGKLSSLNPVVMKDFITYFQEVGELATVEECILRLDVRNLDLHQVVVMCWTHGLYDAMIYVYNRGLQDFTSPLKELLKLLSSSVTTRMKSANRRGNAAAHMSEPEQKLGYKLMFYISCCLSGKAFPTGDLPAQLAERVKSTVYQHILRREATPSFPYARTMLQFDTREFLNVLALAFEGEAGRTAGGAGTEDIRFPTRQVVVDILLEVVITEPERTGERLFSAEQAGVLFTFLARQMARHEASIKVPTAMFEKVLGYLTSTEDVSQHEERQQALLELLDVGIQFSEDRLLRLALQAKFYRVAQFVYRKRRQFEKIIECYLLDRARQREVFTYLHHTLRDTSLERAERNLVQEEAINPLHMAKMVEIDPGAMARLLLLNFAVVIKPIVLSLNQDQKLQFRLLTGIFTVRELLDDDEEVEVEPEVHELYLELMCKARPAAVYPYLKDAANYRVDECLELCRKYRITDATAWLLEKQGNVHAAYAMVHGTVLERIKDLNLAFTEYEQAAAASGDEVEPPGVDPRAAAYKRLRGILGVTIQMCLRCSDRLDEAGREGMWFPLLDALIDSQRAMRQVLVSTAAEYTSLLRDLTKHVVNNMINHCALPAILQKIMVADQVAKSFGEIKDLLFGMLETYNYEKTLLQTTGRIVANDLYWAMRTRHDVTHKATVVGNTPCPVCRRSVLAKDTKEPVVAFQSGEVFRARCYGALAKGPAGRGPRGGARPRQHYFAPRDGSESRVRWQRQRSDRWQAGCG